MSNFPIRLKQLDTVALSGFITGVAKSGVFDIFLQGYISESGFFGTHIVYASGGNQDISGYKNFASGALGPLATGTGQYIPLGQLQNYSGFVNQNFYPTTGNPSGYLNFGVTGVRVTGSNTITGEILITGTSGIQTIRDGQTIIINGVTGDLFPRYETGKFYPSGDNPSGYLVSAVTGVVVDSTALTGELFLSGVSGVTVYNQGQYIIISGNPAGIEFGVTGIRVSGSDAITGEVIFTGISGVKVLLSGNTVIVSGDPSNKFESLFIGGNVFVGPIDSATRLQVSSPHTYFQNRGGESGVLHCGMTLDSSTGVSYSYIDFFSVGAAYWEIGLSHDPSFYSGHFYLYNYPFNTLPIHISLEDDIIISGKLVYESGAADGKIWASNQGGTGSWINLTGTSGIATSFDGSTLTISGSDGWQVTGSEIKNSVVNFTGTAGVTTTLSGDTVIISGDKNDLKTQFYGVFGNATGSGDFNTVAGDTNGTTRLNFYVPSNFQSLVSVQAVGICSAGAAQTARDIDLTSDYGEIGELSNNNSESDTTITYDLSAAAGRITGLDVSSVFTGLAANDFCGVLMTHNAIGGDFNYLGILLRYI